MNYEPPHVQAEFRTSKGTRDQITNIHWIIEKVREFQKNIYFCIIDYAKDFDKAFDKMWPTGEGNSKPLQYSCLENPMNSMKRQNDRILKEELLRSVGAQYATGD